MAEVQIATIRNQVLLSLFTDFENFSVFKPAPQHEKSVNELFDQVGYCLEQRVEGVAVATSIAEAFLKPAWFAFPAAPKNTRTILREFGSWTLTTLPIDYLPLCNPYYGGLIPEQYLASFEKRPQTLTDLRDWKQRAMALISATTPGMHPHPLASAPSRLQRYYYLAL
jgi:hypothetical protein